MIPISKAANARYDAKNTIHYGFKLNRNTDADLIEMLEAADNKQALIKEALRKYRGA
jgi:hypothetical protein